MALNILIACEESQAICKEFRALGHNAYSCDLQTCSGGHPEWHFLGDCLAVIRNGGGNLENGQYALFDGDIDLLIAHPPCTYLTVSGNRWFNVERYGDAARKRIIDREEGAAFFMEFTKTNIKHVAIENPIGIMSTRYRKADQIIQPYQFGHPYTKQTCLWLKDLPLLKPTDVLEKPATGWVNQSFTPDGRYGGFNGKFNGAKERSKTFPGIAHAIATQWSEYLLKK